MAEKETRSKDTRTKDTRKRIQDQIELQEMEHRLALLRKRIELAQSGVRAYQLHRIGEAVRAFHTYLRILEDWKGCKEGELTPALFDVKTEQAELLLISGVFWDLVKLYDRTSTADKHKEFRHYMEKFIVFSKGMPFQMLCAETLRKYISNEKPIHKEDFKNAYKIIGNSNCFVATSLLDVSDPETLPRLRAFRDDRLARSAAGRAFTRWYYRNGPALASAADRLPGGARRALAAALDGLARFVARS